jgi:hypothetical protein
MKIPRFNLFDFKYIDEIIFGLPIPVDYGRRFRAKPATDSD